MTDKEKLMYVFERAYCFPKEKIAEILVDTGFKYLPWNSVMDSLPKLGMKVLCCGIRGSRFIAKLSENGDGELYWVKDHGKGNPVVTHWMPLPEPPKEE
jgi:hypothetical protein